MMMTTMRQNKTTISYQETLSVHSPLPDTHMAAACCEQLVCVSSGTWSQRSS
jgi:hypothetical protein